MLLFLVRTYGERPPDVHYFLKYLLVNTGRTRQPLDRWVIVPDVRPFGLDV
jgi:hypothetical protein